MFTRATLKEYIDKKLISEQVHPEDENVCIYNYTHKCQFDRIWDEVTMNCRGLIIDWSEAIEEKKYYDDGKVETDLIGGKILARPFPKFFNHGEQEVDIPAEEPIITEKMDGSLGIMYTLHGKVWIATRGSFTSDQAIWATKWWRENKGEEPYGNQVTHLFEIIYPENRIVVKYDFSGLVHLASIETETGKQVDHVMPVRPAKKIPHNDLETLSNLNLNNEEGFVIFYPTTGLRLKIKFDEYKRLHRILTNVSAKSIWETLKEGDNLDVFLKDVPDEFYSWVRKTKKDLETQYAEIDTIARRDFLAADVVNRKEFAEYAKSTKYPGVLFSMLDDKDYSQIIWKMIKPSTERGFKTDIDS